MKDIEFDIMGLAEVLDRFRLRVPANQREYAWSEQNVTALLSDLSSSMRKDSNEPYFLGNIVLTATEGDSWEVADGQQRLATVTMILTTIRNFYKKLNLSDASNSVTSQYLYRFVTKEKENLPRLTLNTDDNGYFRKFILEMPEDRDSEIASLRRSHGLIDEASTTIYDHFINLENQYTVHFPDELIRWEEYLKKSARVIVLRVANAKSAFVMFEILNDRGLRVSQVDLVKNYLFGRASERLPEAQTHWSRMMGTVDSIGENDLTLEFLRLSCCVLLGSTRERDIMEKIQNHAQNKTDCLVLLSFLDILSTDYAAILNSDSPKWNGYDENVRNSIKVINLLGVKQIRPLMLAIARYFEPKETAKAFQRLVSWSVRFLILNIKGGRLDEGYASLANLIYEKKITSDDDLKTREIGFIPSDAQFRDAFQIAKVSISKLARYYLRALEKTATNETHPEFVPNEEVVINLEHIMSQMPDGRITPQDIETHYARLGNMVLLQANANTALGSASFEEKKNTYKNSSFILTSQVGDLEKWGVLEIEKRQQVLASMAVKTWKL